MTTIGEHAVVLGASMSGLLAARVLADFYESVTIVERDTLAAEPVNRRGVPQGRQPHVLLARGAQILEGHFPGILDELVANGAPVWDDGDVSKLWLSFGGHRMVNSGHIPDPRSLVNYYPSRPMLEWSVRGHVAALPNVSILQGRDVAALTASPDCTRVTGVRIVHRSALTETDVTADLVVDATGRGSRTPVFLEYLGYHRPLEDELTVRTVYASQLVRIPDGTVHENLILCAPSRYCSRGFGMFRAENDAWLICAVGVGGLEPAHNREEILSIAADLVPEHIVAAARASEPLGEVISYRFPSSRWRRYDKMTRVPDRLLVVGDAMCSVNPIYAQGITKAAVESLTLQSCLRHGDHDLPHRFFNGAAKTIKVAWQTAVGSDLALPQIPGHRSVSTRVSNAYLDKVMTAAERDLFVGQQFMRVIGMIDPPSKLLRPAFVSLVLRQSRSAVDTATARHIPVSPAALSGKE